ncbi:hypothetical protein HPT25_22775 [Bacillus sp. BRMEA1]|uniref:hypothetical protein n=1 Tax=Neobacillus endophyticus TaxID=2738405 RepID=UPI001563758B|nr:hypothetical protein [Neobacillus endophyticus]NRD80164.1 hypothetical protein [Neobacillus endophyticus]
MKKLLIYKEDGEFIIERVNEFGTGFKNHFKTVDGLLGRLDIYQRTNKLEEYQLDVSEDLRANVINLLNE